jgi:hypothetical protein
MVIDVGTRCRDIGERNNRTKTWAIEAFEQFTSTFTATSVMTLTAMVDALRDQFERKCRPANITHGSVLGTMTTADAFE